MDPSQNKRTTFDIIVVGAGASGMMASLAAAGKGASVLLLEKMERPGRKINITGKGRCNITNTAPLSAFLEKTGPDPKFLRNVFSRYFSQHIIDFLNQQGVDTVEERGGRVFPVSNRATDVTETLINALRKEGVTIISRCRVSGILVENGCIFGVETADGEQYTAQRVILTTGGASYPGTGSSGDGYQMLRQAGHHITPILPALVPLNTKGDLAEKLQGVSLKNVTASVWMGGKKLGEEFGEMLFAHFGLTGPIILTLSRRFAVELTKPEGMSVHIDLKPALDHKRLDERLLREINENGARQVQNMVRTLLPASMVELCLNQLDIDPFKPAHQLKGDERKRLRNWLKEFCFDVKGVRGFSEAIITKGGVSTREIDPKTMASKKIKGLFFAGELMDVDADTGGYNLQIAFSTGWVAGEAAAIM